MDEIIKSGENKLNWVRNHMPILNLIEERFKADLPFKGLKIGVCIHLEAKTARLCELLKAGGATVYLTGSNPLSTQDDVAAAVSKRGITVFAKHGCSEKEYFDFISKMINERPNIILDDGGDTVNLIHEKYPQYLNDVLGGCEETTTGVLRLKAREREGKLKFPMILVNDALTKYLFDNRYGTGQSVWTAITNITNLIVAGKVVVVAGYGWCGKGVANRAKSLGGRVIITEIDSIKAIEAHMDGFEVMPMEKACPLGDIFITVTGCKEVITKRHFELLKDGAILSNAGHFNIEVDYNALEEYAISKKEVRNNIVEYLLPSGKRLNLLAEGRLVNLAGGDGHPAEIMDTSFALQALCAEYIAKNKLEPKLYNVPHGIDLNVGKLKLKTLNIDIDSLTKEQEEYLKAYNM